MQCLPDALENLSFYYPSDRGFEAKLAERLEWIKKNRERTRSSNRLSICTAFV